MEPRFSPPHCYVVRTRNGFQARAYSIREDDLNALGRCVAESDHRTLAAAEKAAQRFAKHFGGTYEPRA